MGEELNRDYTLTQKKSIQLKLVCERDLVTSCNQEAVFGNDCLLAMAA